MAWPVLVIGAVIGLIYEALLGRAIFFALERMGRDEIRRDADDVLRNRLGSSYFAVENWTKAEYNNLDSRILLTSSTLSDETLASWTPRDRFFVALAMMGPFVEQDVALNLAPVSGWKAILGIIGTQLLTNLQADALQEFERIAGIEGAWERIKWDFNTLPEVEAEVFRDYINKHGDPGLKGYLDAEVEFGKGGALALVYSIRDLIFAIIPGVDTSTFAKYGDEEEGGNVNKGPEPGFGDMFSSEPKYYPEVMPPDYQPGYPPPMGPIGGSTLPPSWVTGGGMASTAPGFDVGDADNFSPSLEDYWYGPGPQQPGSGFPGFQGNVDVHVELPDFPVIPPIPPVPPPAPSPYIEVRRSELASRSDELAKSGAQIRVDGIYIGRIAATKQGSAFTRLCKSVYGDKNGRTIMLKVAQHPLNAKIRKTSSYGYPQIIGTKGPYFSRAYSGCDTAEGSGNLFPHLFMPDETSP